MDREQLCCISLTPAFVADGPERESVRLACLNVRTLFPENGTSETENDSLKIENLNVHTSERSGKDLGTRYLVCALQIHHHFIVYSPPHA